MPGFDAMLYLAKAIFNYIKQQGIFINRGDVGAWDFFTAAFTIDGEWYDLDLSGIVPAGARWVYLRFMIRDPAVDRFFSFRRKGDTTSLNSLSQATQTGNVNAYSDGFVRLDADRIIQYRGHAIGVFYVSVVIRGWTLA